MSTSEHSTNDSEGRKLAQNIRTKLPREVRDMIYSHVWDERTMKALPFSQLLEPYRREAACLGHSSFCKQLPASTPSIVKKDIVGEVVAAEALEWLYKNSYDIDIGPPDQLLDFFVQDIFGVGVLAQDFKLHKLTTVIATPGPTVSMDFMITSLRMGELKDDFIFEVRICHRDDTTTDAKELIALSASLHDTLNRMNLGNFLIQVTFEHIRGTKWNVTDLLGKTKQEWLDAMWMKLVDEIDDDRMFWEIMHLMNE